MYDQLVVDSQSIQTQLGVSENEDPEWRKRARWALAYKQREMRQLRRWIKEHEQKRPSEWQLLAQAYHLLAGPETTDFRLAGGRLSVRADAAAELRQKIETVVPPEYLASASRATESEA